MKLQLHCRPRPHQQTWQCAQQSTSMLPSLALRQLSAACSVCLCPACIHAASMCCHLQKSPTQDNCLRDSLELAKLRVMPRLRRCRMLQAGTAELMWLRWRWLRMPATGASQQTG